MPAYKATRSMATNGAWKISKPFNEKNLQYAPGSEERQSLSSALSSLKGQLPVTVPALRKKSNTEEPLQTFMPSHTSQAFASYTPATREDVSEAIEAALKSKQAWQDMPFNDRAAIFLRAAELIAGKYRFELLAATMLGQGKNAWQAEIDAAAELADFFRFNVGFAQEIYERQPERTAPGQAG